MGGSSTLRGFAAGTERGPAFWTARAELANNLPAAHLALFADLGQADEWSAFSLERAKMSVGIGASLLDGIFRLDLAHPVRGGSGLRLHAYIDGIF